MKTRMNFIIQFLTYVITHHGYWAAAGIIGIATIPLLLIVYILFSRSTLGQIIDEKMAQRVKSEKKIHLHGNRLRKEFTIAVQDVLQDLAERTEANRAIVFEYSNGTSNLVGLPFLFMTAAAEVATPGLSLISQRHQRLNTSVMAGFLAKLEKEGSIFIDVNSPLLEEYKIVGQIMQGADIQNALFYSIQGIEEAIGFLVILTTKASGKLLDFRTSIHLMSKASQRIGSMINFDEIDEIEKEKHKWKWIWQK